MLADVFNNFRNMCLEIYRSYLAHFISAQELVTQRLNCTQFFIVKIPDNRDPQQIASNHSPDINSPDLLKIYEEYTAKPLFF